MKMQSRAGKVANQSISRGEMYPASFREFPSKKHGAVSFQELGKIRENQEVL